ncbi:hypothetical protein PDESU_03670 [Pontiella desulfatans]|uniref:PEP-CTERM protein-sorting domain-containing protein n=1 Tax=Pontiella desulfatans TaxID=2750659 RepID=A0A6C2U527_PONDE|nr:PEP-CTERM sorting domain-containing protein [Pontiella desulfatans]VGO15090.1 hypothetical protein PDESU_03670 [Pontiella desulfatans]
MNKKQLSLIVAIALLTVGAQAALIIDTGFNALTGTEFPPTLDSNSIFRNGAYDSTGDGWLGGPGMQGTETTVDPVSHAVTFAAAGFSGTAGNWSDAFGQVNLDNKATTGSQTFQVVVDNINANGFEALMEMQFFYFKGTVETANNGIALNATTVGSWWEPIGTVVSTGTITSEGTYTTSAIDFGAGYDVIGFRAQFVELNSSITFEESMTISDISVTAVPEPTIIGMLGVGALATMLIRRTITR